MQFCDIDFETYSEAGYYFDNAGNPHLIKSGKPAIATVGAVVYAEHPSTDILSMAYEFSDRPDKKYWVPQCKTLPYDLIEWIRSGKMLRAWNVTFEYWIYYYVCHKRWGWPELPQSQIFDGMAQALAASLPSSLANCGKVLKLDNEKLSTGKNLINTYSIPKKKTKKYDTVRRPIIKNPVDFFNLITYNQFDVLAQKEIAEKLPPLSDFEYKVWLSNQNMNNRGVRVDLKNVNVCKEAIDKIFAYQEQRLRRLTNGAVETAGQNERLRRWIQFKTPDGTSIKSVDKKAIIELLNDPKISDEVKEVLKVKQMLSSGSTKKILAFLYKVSHDGRVRDILTYCGADRTGRFGGKGIQIHNFPKSKLNVEEAEEIFEKLKDPIKNFDDPLDIISQCLRFLIISDEDKDFISSDYRAIEAVVLACLAREQWRIDVFKTHGKIYELSASKITGVPFEEFLEYKRVNGEHHPYRNTIGKVAELASGYQGWVGAWKQFGADKYFKSDDEIADACKKWRKESPNIVNFWYGVERAAIDAIKWGNGRITKYNDIKYKFTNGNLYCELPSGRCLTYWNAGLELYVDPYGREREKIFFYGWNSDTKNGPRGWIKFYTYGGKLTENIVQAVSRDILCYAILNLEKNGYTVAFHVHDEIIAEILKNFGSIEEFEMIISALPKWAASWPIIAAGGWRGTRFRKDG